VGPPSELYAHPNNLFVAGFIGSPSMNFLSGEISGDNVHLPIGDVRMPDELRHRLESGPGGGRRGVIAGLRPERFDDAALVADRSRGVTFTAKIDVLESMGSEFYAYFVVESEAVSSSELDELAADAGGADLPTALGGIQVTARLGAESRAQQGAEAELWFDSTHLQLFDPESGRSLLATDGAPASTQAPTSTQAPMSTQAPTATPPQAPPAS
jgi:multiple sugar transport system ATP-binding protein